MRCKLINHYQVILTDQRLKYCVFFRLTNDITRLNALNASMKKQLGESLVKHEERVRGIGKEKTALTKANKEMVSYTDYFPHFVSVRFWDCVFFNFRKWNWRRSNKSWSIPKIYAKLFWKRWWPNARRIRIRRNDLIEWKTDCN